MNASSPKSSEQEPATTERKVDSRRGIVIGASAGAIGALDRILPSLPKDFPWPILIVVHLPPDRNSVLAELFASRCSLTVKEAEDKETIAGGTIYFAPPNYHLLVEPDFCLSLSDDEPVLFSRPSINVLFEAAADAFGTGLIGIVLTGASSDGAAGLQAVSEAGGQVFVQNPKTAEVSTMPEAALRANPGAGSLTVREIAEMLSTLPR